MRRFRPRGGIALLACGIIPLLMTGCLMPYAYPTVSYVPPVSVGPAREEVHAFRVDIADQDNSSVRLPERDRYVLRPLPLHPDGSFDSQVKVAFDYGWILNCLAYFSDGWTHHTMLVRLYRPGYQTIEIESWQQNSRLQWIEARSPEEQEQAIDDLVSTWNTTPVSVQNHVSQTGFVPPRDPIVFRYLAPGSAGQEHVRALQFAANEYTRLTRNLPDSELRTRLLAKEKALRHLAVQ
jgi:hypothetical protein